MTAIILKPGLVFTGKPGTGFFTGRVEIISLFDNDKYAAVRLTQITGVKFSGAPNVLPIHNEYQPAPEFKIWIEEWWVETLQNSFANGNYFENNDWPGYPPLYYFNHQGNHQMAGNHTKPFAAPDPPNPTTAQFNKNFTTSAIDLLNNQDNRIFAIAGINSNGDMQLVYPPSLTLDHVIQQLEICIGELKTTLQNSNQPETN